MFVLRDIGIEGERKSLRFLHLQPKGRKKKKITKPTSVVSKRNPLQEYAY
ncbi:MAG: hypothetical protein HN531_11060 [Opitutae bacterium]|jgi:hypothetical protein|nr:hypothetical protein [Opitutae bacterium]